VPTYKYQVKKTPDLMVRGTVEALSEKEAVEKLGRMGYLPIKLEEELSVPGAPRFPAVFSPRLGRKIKSPEITVFSRQLASLLKSGVAILNAIRIIMEQSENPRLRSLLHQIHDAVREGSSFSSVLTQFPDVFPAVYVAMVRVGETSGSLPEVLLRMAHYRAKQEQVFSHFRMALIYPFFMAVVGCGTVIFMLSFVVPRLMRVYERLGGDLPLPTQILLSVSTGIRREGFWIVLAAAIGLLLLRQELRTQHGKIFWSSLKLHTPFFGRFILKTELCRFARGLGLLIENGIPILRSLDVVIPLLQNEVIKNQLRQSSQQLEQGGSLGRFLKDSPWIPPFMSNLIIVGEESGKLKESLAEVADSYEQDIEEAVKVLTSLVEPLLILAMALVVGFIVVAMLLPIFQINMMIK